MDAPRMVVTDMDGTLLNATGRAVSERNRDALRRADAAGAKVLIATGRPVWWLDPLLDMGFGGLAVCMNGAVVYDVTAGSIVASSPLSAGTLQRFVGALDQAGLDYSIAVERMGTTMGSCWSDETYDHPWEIGEYKVAPRADLLAEPAAKLLVRFAGHSGVLAAAARQAADNDVHITYSTDDGLIEVAAAGVNKGSALAALAAQWGIERSEVVAFGDMPNDLEMLSWAGHGVAMGNAHPDVVAVAAEVGPHHDQDGVAQVLERWF